MDQLLKVFISVVELRNFTKAAEQLHMTQPAVSQAIKNLEIKFGKTLIERENKEFHVNQAGEIVYALGKEIDEKLTMMDVLVNELDQEPSGKIIIGASYTIGEYLLPKLLTELHETFPNIQAHVLIGNTKAIGTKLLNREIDVGFIEGTFTHHKIKVIPFMEDTMYICSNMMKKNKSYPTVKQLQKEVWLFREEGSGTRDMMIQFLKQHHIKPEQKRTLGSTQLVKEAVQAGLGISLMSETAIIKERELGTIFPLLNDSLTVSRTFSFIKYASSFEPKTYEIIEQKVKEIWSTSHFSDYFNK